MENGKGAWATNLESGVGFGSTEFHVLRANNFGDPQFIYHLSLSDELRKKAVTNFTGSAGQQRVSTDFFFRYKLLLPPLFEQRKIARILTTVDNLIENTEALIAKYQAIKQGMMQDLFARGVDEHGRLRPTFEEAPELYKESELGWIPKGWHSVRLGDHTTVKARLGWKGLKAEEYVDDGYIFLSTPNLKGNQIDFHNVDFISKWRYEESPEIQLREHDVLIVKDGSTLGICSFVRKMPRPATVNGSIAVVRTKRNTLYPEFLFHYVNGEDFQKLITLKKAGLGVPHLFQADLREFVISLPPITEQCTIALILTTVDNQIEKTESLIAKYQAIKRGLMQDLLTGKVRVKTDTETEDV